MTELKVKFLSSLLDKSLGLVNIEKAYPVLLKTRFGIHTFGVRFPIDVLILNKQNKVVALKESLKQNRIFLWSPLYDTVIELPTGYIDTYKIKVGDMIKVIAV